MKYLIILFFSLTYFINAEDYIFESSANLKSENMIIADNFSVKNMSIEIRWTDSLGEYGKGRCIGLSTKKISEVRFKVYCEYYDSDEDMFWTLLERSNSDAAAGVGVATYLNATGKYKDFIGLKCNYAVNYMGEETNFYRHKCQIKN